MNRIFILLACIAFCSLSQAAPITVSFKGEVTSVGSLLQGDGVNTNDTITGQFTYDDSVFGTRTRTNTPSSGGTRVRLDNALFSFDLQIGTFSTSLIPLGNDITFIYNDTLHGSGNTTDPSDGFRLRGRATSTGLNGYDIVERQEFGFRRSNSDGQLWSNNDLPSLSDWQNITLDDLNQTGPNWRLIRFDVEGDPIDRNADRQIRYNITSFTAHSVPEPSAIALLCFAFCGFFLTRKK